MRPRFRAKGTTTMKQMALAVLAVLMFIPAAHADGAPTDPNYLVTFTTVFTSVTGATETLSGTLELEYSMEAGGYVLDPGTGQVISSGFLGTFTEPVQQDAAYIALFGGAGCNEFCHADEIDLYFYGPPTDFTQFQFELFTCATVACVDAYPGPESGFFAGGDTTYSVTALVPEPSVLMMVLAGLLSLAAIKLGKGVYRIPRITQS